MLPAKVAEYTEDSGTVRIMLPINGLTMILTMRARAAQIRRNATLAISRKIQERVPIFYFMTKKPENTYTWSCNYDITGPH